MTACKRVPNLSYPSVVLQEAGGGGSSDGLRSFHRTSNSALYLLRFQALDEKVVWFSEHTPTCPDTPIARGVAMLWR